MAFEALAAEMTLDSSGFTRGMTAAKASMSDAESQASSMKRTMGKMGAGIAALGAGALAGATAAAAKFETQLVELEKVSSAEFASDFRETIMEMSRELPQTANELANVSAAAKRFGVAEENVESFVRATSKMATATDLNIDQVGESFAKLATLTDTPVPKIENLGSSINELSNTMATSSSEIVDSMMRSAGALSQLGVSQTDIAGLSAALNAVSESSERAGSRLRRMAQELVDPRKIGDIASAFGVTSDKFKQMVKNDPTDVILQMAEKMKAGGKEADLLNSTLSTTSRQALAGLGSNLDQVNQALDTSKAAFKENTSLQKEYEAAMDTAAMQAQQLKSSILAVAIETGTVLLPYVTDAIKALRGMVDAFGRLNSETNGMAGVLAGLSLVVGGLATAFVGLYPAITAATPALSIMATAASSVLAPAALLTGAILGLAAAFKDDFAGIATMANRVLGAIQEEFDATATLLRTVFGPALGAAAGAFETFRSRAEQAIRPVVDLVGTQLVGGVRSAGSRIRGELLTLGAAWEAHRDRVLGTLQNFKERLVFQFNVALQALNALANGNVQKFKQVVGRMFASAKAAATTRLNELKTAVGDKFAELKPTVKEKLEQVVAAAPAALAALETKLPEPIQNAIDEAKKPIGDLVTAFQDLKPKILTAIRPLTQPLQKLGEKLGYITKQGKPTKKSLAGVGLALAGLSNPITTAMGLVVGLSKVWDTNLFGIRDTTEQALGRVRTVWETEIRPLVDDARRIFSQVADVVSEYLTWILENSFKPILRSILQLWETHGAELIGELVETYEVLKQATQALMDILVPIIKAALDAIMAFWNEFGDEILAVTKFAFDAIGSVINTALDLLFTIIQVGLNLIQGDWDEAWDAMAGFLERTFDGIISFVEKWGSGFLDYIVGLLDDIYQGFVDWATDLIWGSLIPDMLSDILSEFVTFFDNLISDLGTFVTNFLDDAGTFFSDLLSDFQTGFQNVRDDVASKAEGVKDDVLGFMGDMKDSVVGDRGIIPNLKSEAVGFIEDIGDEGATAFKNAWNSAIPSRLGIPSVSVDIPDFMGGGSRSIGGGSISLPQLASGGIVTDPTLAMVGEGSESEAVLPLSKLESMLNADGGGGASVDVQQIDIRVNGSDDPEAVAKLVREDLSNELERVLGRSTT